MVWTSTMGPPFRATTVSCLPLLVFIALAVGNVQAMYSSSSPVTQLDPSNFRKTIKGGVWLVEFYAPWCGHCKSLKGDWEKAAKALKGIVGVAAVDADEHKQLGGEYNVQGFPTIKLMYEKGGSIKAVDYQGARSASAIVEWAMAQAKKIALSRLGAKPSSEGKGSSGGGSQGGSGGGGDGSFYPSSSDVVNLSDVSFQDDVLESEDLWFVEFFAPWCGHCKALKPAWMEAAKELKGKVKVGAVDCTVSQTSCQSMGVSGYPTIKFFGTNKRRPEDYNGERSSSGIVEFATQRWSRLAPAPKVAELTEQQQMEDECEGHAGDEALGLAQVPPKQLCLLAFMPDILDSGAAGRNAYISALQKLAEAYKDRPFSYLWVEAGAQVALEANFQVGGAGYPALVAYSPKNGKYASLHSAFEYKALTEFVGNVRQGFEAVRPLAGELAPVQVRVPWDGKDGVPPEEDEFDLADIMNEEL